MASLLGTTMEMDADEEVDLAAVRTERSNLERRVLGTAGLLREDSEESMFPAMPESVMDTVRQLLLTMPCWHSYFSCWFGFGFGFWFGCYFLKVKVRSSPFQLRVADIVLHLCSVKYIPPSIIALHAQLRFDRYTSVLRAILLQLQDQRKGLLTDLKALTTTTFLNQR